MVQKLCCRCEISVSEPLVPYRETILPCDAGYTHTLPPPWCDLPGLSDVSGGTSKLVTAGGHVSLSLSCYPLPAAVLRLLVAQPEAAGYVTDWRYRFPEK